MTTILGIKTNSGLDSIVLASDTQILVDYETSARKVAGSKIKVEDDYVIAFTGIKVKLVERFFSYISGRTSPENFVKEALKNKIHPIFRSLPKNPVQVAIEAGYFPELALVNSDLYMRKYDEISFEEIFKELPELIIATRKPSFGLYRVDSFGRVSSSSQSIEYLTSGSGEEIVKTYINEGEYQDDSLVGEHIVEDKITTKIALKLVIGAMKKATRDHNTGGPIDIVVLTLESMEVYGQEIKRFLAEAEKQIYEKIIEKYS